MKAPKKDDYRRAARLIARILLAYNKGHWTPLSPDDWGALGLERHEELVNEIFEEILRDERKESARNDPGATT